MEGGVGDVQSGRRQPVLGELSRNEEATSDVELLFLAVSRQLDHFHAIQQCRMERAELIRSRDEQHAGQIERRFEVVIPERVVLRRIQHFEQRGRRIALEADCDLVHFVEHEHRIGRTRLTKRLNDSSGDRADVRPAVSADFRLVAHATE